MVPVPCGDFVVEKRARFSMLKGTAKRSGKFRLQFSCIPKRNPSCGKARDTFWHAFEVLESYLILKKDIVVNASYFDFCTVRGECEKDGLQTLGKIDVMRMRGERIQESSGL